MKPVCTIEECDKEQEARGFCHTHYTRLWRHGTPHAKHGYSETGDRLCADCGQIIPREDVESQPRRCYCKPCERIRWNGWKLKNLTKARLHAFQSKLRKYGITLEKFEELSRTQGGVCAICGTSDVGENRMFDIDHDHLHCSGGKSCGACVRGLVCRSCNMFMGIAKDNPVNLRNAADYIEKFRLDNPELFRG